MREISDPKAFATTDKATQQITPPSYKYRVDPTSTFSEQLHFSITPPRSFDRRALATD